MSTGLVTLVAIAILLLMAIACAHAYKSAEIHELHKMRASFEKIELDLEKKYRNNILERDRASEIRGEIEGLKEAIRALEEEEASLK
jgi:hypothetical protein